MNVLERRAVGSALQRGLMGLSGYFDGDRWPHGPPPADLAIPDWAVTMYAVEPRDTRFPVRVHGFNLNCAPGEYGHKFDWRVPALGWRYRFELCPGAEGSLTQ